MNIDPKTRLNTQETPTGAKRLNRFYRLLLPALVLAAGIALGVWLMGTGPKAKTRPKTRNATLVDIKPVVFGPQTTLISAMGTVKPDRSIDLKPQVSGEVIRLHPDFVPGGHFRKGESLLQIDPADYQLTIRQQESEVSRVEAEIQMEQGNQLVAQKEYELLGEEVSAEEQALMLRQPQLESLRASLAAAQARLDLARLDLARTSIKAPFNAIVQSREVNLGTRVTTGTSLATLIGTDAYWVETSVPVSQLRWIKIPQADGQPGSKVRIYDTAAWGAQPYREGEVIRLAAGLEEQGRMARLLVRVKDPLALAPAHAGQPTMLIDAYVRVEIAGQKLAQAAAIDRQLIRDNETVWVMDADGRLDIRPVEIIFRGRNQVLVGDGLFPGENLVVSALPTPVQGMPLRLADMPVEASRQPAEEKRAQ